MVELEFVTLVPSSRELVWSGVSTFYGVNQEFFPLLRMTCPFPDLRLTSAMATGLPLFRSWLLLFGVLPIEFDLLCITSVSESHSFTEKSSMALISEWNHHRSLEDEEEQENEDKTEMQDGSRRGTIIRDRLSFTPRIPGSGFILSLIVRSLFSYRHMRLRRLYS
jgi:hypothetical protein